MAGRTHRRARAPLDAEGTGADEGDDEEPSEQLPESSLQDLTQPADPTSFDETFTDDDANLRIQGGFDPTAGAKQVIPRVAYVLDFNLVWNPERGRWEPQKKAELIEDDEDTTGGEGDTILVAVEFFTGLIAAGSKASSTVSDGLTTQITTSSPQKATSSISEI